MRTLLVVALSLLTWSAAAPDAHAVLVSTEINGVWGDTSWELRYGRPPTAEDAPSERVRVHLEAVLQRLREVDPAGLPAEVQARRARALDALAEYVAVGFYPRNVDDVFARPEFVDADGALCAVGAMVAATAGREAAVAIDAAFNRDSVWAMDDARVAAWAATHGFSALELATIQPAYPPEWDHPRYHREFALGGRVGAVVWGTSDYDDGFEALTMTSATALDLGLLMLWEPGIHWGLGFALNLQSNVEDFYEGSHLGVSLNLMGEYCAPLRDDGGLDLILYLELGPLFLPEDEAFAGLNYGAGVALEFPLGITRTSGRVDVRGLGYHLWSQPGRRQEIDGFEVLTTVGALFRFD
ncbi:MAG: hypothetical protein EP329_08585 [Deltaproteobacteria bacterium]|nr:MAG: hypothetical protein EP329_08585 [Deltaproteobacteria bacterium]